MSTHQRPTTRQASTKRLAAIATLAAAAVAATPSPAAIADGPDIERASHVDRFKDNFILELCGIETWTTVTERWSSKTFPDGSETFHAVRTFVPDDPRIPIEKGAATMFIRPDGSRTLVGKPVQLFGPDGGTTLIDAGRVQYDTQGNVVSANGQHPSLDTDLATHYCPS